MESESTSGVDASAAAVRYDWMHCPTHAFSVKEGARWLLATYHFSCACTKWPFQRELKSLKVFVSLSVRRVSPLANPAEG